MMSANSYSPEVDDSSLPESVSESASSALWIVKAADSTMSLVRAAFAFSSCWETSSRPGSSIETASKVQS